MIFFNNDSKISRKCRRPVWMFCIFFLYIYFYTETLKSHRKEIKIPSILEYKIINTDLNPPSVVNNFPIKGESILETKYPISMYYRLLKEYSGVCRKLARFGGDAQCRKRNQTEFYLDGQKILCIEPEMRIFNSTKTEDCLVLSFGTLTEITFDLRLRDANCEVHLFDLLNYKPLLQLNDTFMTFHQIGLGVANSETSYTIQNFTLTYNTFDNILFKLNATFKLINVLKIDIEGDEWEALDYMLKGSLLASVGQIAIEVHDIFEKDKKISEALYRSKLRILLKLEGEGFRRVRYEDNKACALVTDEFGIKHCHAGELLLVNINWYDANYMKTLVEKLKYLNKK
ncbi:UNVERIFIED_CONTAM: hypothetical protein RMT77_008307 [Armadillidium vulgare]